jgi:hypothetical protein
VCFPIHVNGEYDKRKQARLPSSHGKSLVFIFCKSTYHEDTQATEPSRSLYATFLESLKVAYKPGKIKGMLLLF